MSEPQLSSWSSVPESPPKQALVLSLLEHGRWSRSLRQVARSYSPARTLQIHRKQNLFTKAQEDLKLLGLLN